MSETAKTLERDEAFRKLKRNSIPRGRREWFDAGFDAGASSVQAVSEDGRPSVDEVAEALFDKLDDGKDSVPWNRPGKHQSNVRRWYRRYAQAAIDTLFAPPSPQSAPETVLPEYEREADLAWDAWRAATTPEAPLENQGDASELSEQLQGMAATVRRLYVHILHGGAVTAENMSQIVQRLETIATSTPEAVGPGDGWIDVKAACPKIGQPCLLWHPSWTMIVFGGVDEEGEWCGNYGGKFEPETLPYNNPTYWRPLPAPPSGEQSQPLPVVWPPPYYADDISLRMAGEITKFWRCIDTSPRRAQHKAKIQVAIGQAIVQALMDTTAEELGPNR